MGVQKGNWVFLLLILGLISPIRGRAAEPCRIAVATLQNTTAPINGVAARDLLAELLNNHQVAAVSLATPLADESMGTEARQRNCGLLVVGSLAGLSGSGVVPARRLTPRRFSARKSWTALALADCCLAISVCALASFSA